MHVNYLQIKSLILKDPKIVANEIYFPYLFLNEIQGFTVLGYHYKDELSHIGVLKKISLFEITS